jgi:hypothetical protein
VISIFPNHSETLVTTQTADQVLARIAIEFEKPFGGKYGTSLAGWVEGPDFQLTIQSRRQHLFMPRLEGRVETTSKGCIILLRYALFPGTRLLLIFWTVVLPVASAFVSHQQNNLWIFGGAMLSLLLIYVIGWGNFRLHVKTTQSIVHAVLT